MAKSKCRWESPEEWSEWSGWLAAGLHACNRWRLPVLLVGMLLASGRRTVATWLRAAGVSDDYQDYYYFLECVGRKSDSIATRLVALVLRRLPLPDLVLLVIDDSPTRRYGPKVEGADVHHNPTPGPAGQPFLYGHIWVTIALALRHPEWGALALPLRAMLYVRRQTMATIPKSRRWPRFATKLQLAARLVEWIVLLLKKAGNRLWIVVDGGYTRRPFLRRVLAISGVVVVGRLCKDAHLRDLIFNTANPTGLVSKGTMDVVISGLTPRQYTFTGYFHDNTVNHFLMDVAVSSDGGAIFFPRVDNAFVSTGTNPATVGSGTFQFVAGA